MATFYFNGAVDGDWNTLGNWWTNAEFTISATSLPTASDDVVISPIDPVPGFGHRGVVANSGPVPVVANMLVKHASTGMGGYTMIGIEVTVTGLATFDGYDSYLYTTDPASSIAKVNGNCLFINEASVFYENTIGDAVVNGNATFNDNSYSEGGLITGNATFNDSSYNSGTVTGNATFNDSSGNNSTVTGDATFNDSSLNFGTVTGDATFNDSSYNIGTVTGDATFNDSSYNDDGYGYGTVGGSATFRGSSYNKSGVGGNVILAYEKGINGSSILGVV